MGFKLWTTGELLTSSDVNDYLMKQSVISCTSGTRPSSPQDGMVIWETDTERYVSFNATLSGWKPIGQQISSTVTPVLTAATTNPVLGTGNVATAKYTLWNGRMCTYWGYIAFGTTGVNAGSGQYFISLPFQAAASSLSFTSGSAVVRDNSANDIRNATCYLSQNATTLSLIASDAIVSSTVTWTWAASDYMHWNITYETA